MVPKSEVAPLIPHTASIAGQTHLLLTDAELWNVAPGHAYGLIAITVIDFLVFPLFVLGHSLRRKLLTVWVLLKLVLILGDVLTAPEFGLSYLEFAAYLFGLPGYVIAVAAQPLVVAAVMLTGRRNSGKEGSRLPTSQIS